MAQLRGIDGEWQQADVAVFAGIMAEKRTARRLAAKERSRVKAQEREAHIARHRRRKAEREDEAAKRRLAKIERDLELDLAWGRPLLIRVELPPLPPAARKQPKPSGPRARVGRVMRTYTAPILDGRGRQTFHFKCRYKGLKSADWRAGLTVKHADYILRPEAQERDASGASLPISSNIGETRAEILAFWRVLEQVEEAYRSSAKVMQTIVWSLPHGLSAEDAGSW